MDSLIAKTFKNKLGKKLYKILNDYTKEIKNHDIELFDMQEIFNEQLDEFYSSINAEKVKNEFGSAEIVNKISIKLINEIDKIYYKHREDIYTNINFELGGISIKYEEYEDIDTNCARTIIGDFCEIPSDMDEDLCNDESYVHNYYKKYYNKKIFSKNIKHTELTIDEFIKLCFNIIDITIRIL